MRFCKKHKTLMDLDEECVFCKREKRLRLREVGK